MASILATFEIYGDGERRSRPIGEIVLFGLVLCEQEAPRKRILLGGGFHDASYTRVHVRSDSHADERLALQIANPIRALTSAREHVQRVAVKSEPNLDRARIARPAPTRGQVTVLFRGERRIDDH